jgi:hypothetical protein
VVGGWWLVVGGWWLVVGGWWLVVGRWSLVVGRWWLVVGGWWLVVGRWSLENRYVGENLIKNSFQPFRLQTSGLLLPLFRLVVGKILFCFSKLDARVSLSSDISMNLTIPLIKIKQVGELLFFLIFLQQ